MDWDKNSRDEDPNCNLLFNDNYFEKLFQKTQTNENFDIEIDDYMMKPMNETNLFKNIKITNNSI